jgi:hypothetical protein
MGKHYKKLKKSLDILVEQECDRILSRSKYAQTFEAEDSEVDGELTRYFDAVGNCLVINSETTQIIHIPADKIV